MRITILEITKNGSTTTALTSTSRSKIKKSENNPFTPIQYQQKTTKDFFNSTPPKLTAEFYSESPAALIKDSTATDSHEIKLLKKG